MSALLLAHQTSLLLLEVVESIKFQLLLFFPILNKLQLGSIDAFVPPIANLSRLFQIIHMVFECEFDELRCFFGVVEYNDKFLLIQA